MACWWLGTKGTRQWPDVLSWFWKQQFPTRTSERHGSPDMYGTPAPPNVCSDAVFALLHTFVQNVELILHNSMHGITSSWNHHLDSRKTTLWECSEFVGHKSLCASSTSMLPTFAIHGPSDYLYQVKHIRFTATCVGWFICPWVCICLLQEQQLHYCKHMHWAHPTIYVTDRHWLQGPFLFHFVANTSNPWAAFAQHSTSPKIMACTSSLSSSHLSVHPLSFHLSVHHHPL
jgi:hypothetical protein